MVDTPLNYDKQIWTVFSVGIISSVVILYNFHRELIPKQGTLWALILGFSILIYSIMLILGYSFKKKRLIDVSEDEEIERLDNDLSQKFYFRTKWMGEIILAIIIWLYAKSFDSYLIPLLIILVALNLTLISNIWELMKS